MTSRSERARNLIRGIAPEGKTAEERAARNTAARNAAAKNGAGEPSAAQSRTTPRAGAKSHAARNIGAGIDLTIPDAIRFGYVSELARPGRIIGGRHRLRAPLQGSSRRGAQAAASGFYGSSLWRADSIRCGHPVLIELLDPAIAEDESLADLFTTEARAASAVSSPFVSRVLDFGVEACTPYLVTELPLCEASARDPGETLASRIAARQLPSFLDFRPLFHDLCRGVGAMHERGVLHRDLRSERVALLRTPLPAGGERETPKLSFGISKLMNDTLELVRTMARRAVAPAATPQYASPEQVLGTSPLGPACDVWSLAVIAFECTTGELPFVGATIGERLVQICAGPARVPSALRPVPRGFDAWFARGVKKAPEERWASLGEMSDAWLALSPS